MVTKLQLLTKSFQKRVTTQIEELFFLQILYFKVTTRLRCNYIVKDVNNKKPYKVVTVLFDMDIFKRESSVTWC